MDGTGNAYVTGETTSSNFPTTPGAFQTSYGGNIDGFVTKFPAVTIATATLADWTVNQPGYSQTISASGGTGTLTFSATRHPAHRPDPEQRRRALGYADDRG